VSAIWPAQSVIPAAPAPAAPPDIFRLRACAATETSYELALQDSGPHSITLTDLANPANRVTAIGQGAASYLISRSQAWNLFPQTPQFAALGAFLNAASFTPDLAPGGLLSISGVGLAGVAPTRVEIGGVAAEVLASSSFRVTVRVPPALQAGRYPLRLTSQFGTASAMIDLREVAPAITIMGGAQQGAVVNPDGQLNAPDRAVARGQYVTVYGTGFSSAPVQAEIDGQSVPVLFAGSTSGFPGLVQVNVSLPAGLAPGIGKMLLLRQSGVASNLVTITVE
jgi:uncharacterized protein (TIGR03437 family)